MSNASRIYRTGRLWKDIEDRRMRGDVISIFDHHSNERLDLNVRVGMTADACSGPFSRRVRESPLRLASSVFYRALVKNFAENKIRNKAHEGV